MKTQDSIKAVLAKALVMQLATSSGDAPWVCTVYFVEYEQKLFWLSLPTRTHSKHIQANPQVAVALVGKVEQPVIGVQGKGRASVVTDKKVIKQVMQRYIDKYQAGKQFYDNFVAGNNQHWLYEFAPEEYVLFDEHNFKDKPSQSWIL